VVFFIAALMAAAPVTFHIAPKDPAMPKLFPVIVTNEPPSERPVEGVMPEVDEKKGEGYSILSPTLRVSFVKIFTVTEPTQAGIVSLIN
jgi:hypothetical protein